MTSLNRLLRAALGIVLLSVLIQHAGFAQAVSGNIIGTVTELCSFGVVTGAAASTTAGRLRGSSLTPTPYRWIPTPTSDPPPTRRLV